jgi:hypothetical protein
MGTRVIGPFAPVNRKLTVCLGGSLPSMVGGAGGAANWIESVFASPGRRTLESPLGRYFFPGGAIGGRTSYRCWVWSSIITVEVSENGFKSSGDASVGLAPTGTGLPMPRNVPPAGALAVAMTRTKTSRRLSRMRSILEMARRMPGHLVSTCAKLVPRALRSCATRSVTKQRLAAMTTKESDFIKRTGDSAERLIRVKVLLCDLNPKQCLCFPYRTSSEATTRYRYRGSKG